MHLNAREPLVQSYIMTEPRPEPRCPGFYASALQSVFFFSLKRHKATNMYYLVLTVTVVQGCRCNLAGCLWLRVSHGVAAIPSVRATVSSEGSTDRIVSKIPCEVVVRPCHVGLFIGSPQDLQLASTRASNLREWGSKGPRWKPWSSYILKAVSV